MKSNDSEKKYEKKKHLVSTNKAAKWVPNDV